MNHSIYRQENSNELVATIARKVASIQPNEKRKVFDCVENADVKKLAKIREWDLPKLEILNAEANYALVRQVRKRKFANLENNHDDTDKTKGK